MEDENRESGEVEVRAFNLRPVQVEALENVRASWRTGQRRALLVLPTGVGKTITALEAVRRAVERDPEARVLWLAHRAELVTQPLEAVQSLDHFASVAEVAGEVRGTAADYGARVVFSSVQTMINRAAAYTEHGRPSLVVIDEAHHYVPGMTWGDVALSLAGAEGDALGCHVLGLTATPERADALRLSSMWGELPAFSLSTQEAIDDGYLVPPVIHDVRLQVSAELEEAIELANSEEGDDEDANLAQRLLAEGIADHVRDVCAGIRGRPALVFCMSVAQVVETWETLTNDGHRAGYITGTTGKRDRAAILAAYRAGDLDVLVNCGVLTEGTDLPRTSDIVMARPCGSKSLYVQIVGRAARLYPGKETFAVWDVLGASQVHTLVTSVALDIGGAYVPHATWISVIDSDTAEFFAPKGSRWDAELITAPTGMELLKLYRPQPKAGGRPGGALYADGPIVVSPDLFCPARPRGLGAGKARVSNPLSSGRAWRPTWIDLGDGVRALGLASYGTAYTVETEEGDMWPIMVPPRARQPRPLNSRAVRPEVASALVAEVGRHAARVVDSQAEWRAANVTQGQRAYLDRLGITDDIQTRGEAGRRIDKAKAERTAARLGICRGWSPAGAS